MNVRVVPFTEAHVTDLYLGWLQDTHLLRYSKQRFRTHTTGSCLNYLRSFADSPNGFWAIEADGAHVGTLTSYVDAHDGVADVGILVGVPGRGYGSAAWGLLLDHLFAGGLRRVTCGTLAINTPMVRIALRWGMRLEGTRRDQEIIDGRPVDQVLFGLMREDHRRSPPY